MAEGAPLLRVYRLTAYRGFESLPLRQIARSGSTRRGASFESPGRACVPGSFAPGPGEVTEWLKVRAWKVRVPARVPRVRIPPSPPLSLRLRRLPVRISAQAEKSPRFRGVLGVRPSRIRTGDCGFRAANTLQPVSVSVAEFGGSDSLEIRLA